MPQVQLEEVVLAEPRGFCAGVDRAIEIVERALKTSVAPAGTSANSSMKIAPRDFRSLTT